MNNILKSNLSIVVLLFISAIVIGGTSLKCKWPPKIHTLTNEMKNSDKILKIIYPLNYEQLDNKVLQKRLDEAIALMTKEESIVKYLLKKNLVKKNEWNRRYSGYILFETPKIGYSYEFTTDFKAISSVTKNIYEDKSYRKKKKSGGHLDFYTDTESVKYFNYGYFLQKVELSFYKNKRLKHCHLSIGNKYYDCKWDEDGKLLSTETRQIPKLLLKKHKEKQQNSKTE